jgi:PAS domain S-box-containing protein
MSHRHPILLIEDNPMDIDLTVRAFQRRRLTNPIEIARDGEEALAKVSEWEAGAPLPVLILLDLKLPKVDGLEVLRQLKAHPSLRTIPVVVLTTSNQQSDDRAAYNVGLWDWELGTNRVYYSKEWKRQIGHGEPEIGDDLEEWRSRVHPEDLQRTLDAVQQCLARKGDDYRADFRFRHKDGSYRHILAYGSVVLDHHGRAVRMVGSHVDITERVQLEAQLSQAQKMESVGRLAGGIAHDFNNILTVINNYAELAAAEVVAGSRIDDMLREIRTAGQRATQLTRQLLTFSRRQIVRFEILDLNTIVTGIISMLRRLLGEDITLSFEAAPELGRVRADPGQIEQILMNLAVNARDAMPSGGQLRVATANAVEIASEPSQPAGAYVLLSVQDTGIGMEQAVLERIFEPFFTTKEAGKGTGLGLSTVHGIVSQCGGFIRVASQPGAGTGFRIYLPQVQAEAVTEATPPPDSLVRGAGRILIVEDEPAVRDLVRQALEEAGYEVLVAGNVKDALHQIELTDKPLYLLITDLVLPGGTGLDLVEHLRVLRPGLPILLTSGYSDQMADRRSLDHRNYGFLAKPFTLAALTRSVRDLLTS